MTLLTGGTAGCMPLTFLTEGRPSDELAIHTGDTVDILAAPQELEAPSDEYIDELLTFLEGFRYQSMLDNRKDLIFFTQDVYSLVEKLRTMGEDLEAYIVLFAGSEQEADLINKRVALRQRLATVAGFVELLRVPEVEAVLRDPATTQKSAEGVLLADVNIQEYEYMGLHVDAAVLKRLGLAMPKHEDEEEWYANESVFVRAKRPPAMSLGIEMSMDPTDVQDLQTIALASLVARVRRAKW